VKARPGRCEPRLLIAKLWMEADQHDAALECVQQALHDGIDDPRLHYWLGIIYAAQGRLDRARQYLEAYLMNRPGNRDARVLLANLLSARALTDTDKLEVKDLQVLADRIHDLNPDDPKGYLVKAAVLTKSRPRQYVAAIVLIEKARDRMPDNPEVARRLAAAHRDYGWLLSLKKRDLAMDHFLTFLRLAPKEMATEAVRNAVVAHCKSLERRGRESLLRGDSKASVASFRRSTELLPERDESFFQLGLAHQYEEELGSAVACFERALRLGRKLGKDVSHVMLPLLDLLMRTGRAEEAARRGAKFLQEAPPNADPPTLEKIRALLQGDRR